MEFKETIFGIIGIVGSVFAAVFGGWNAAMTTLLILMAADYITGLMVAGLFHKSNKTENGLLDSSVGWQGLAKKALVLLFVLIAHRLDMALGSSYIKDAVCIAYTANELVSLIENAGLMGVPIPKPICNALEALKRKEEE